MFKNIVNTINKSNALVFLISLISIVAYIAIFYPGLMSPDSRHIYSQAKTAIYGDHHPPMMAYLWRFFLNFHDGSALMFLSSMSMLWGSCMIMLFIIFKNRSWRLLCLLIPFIPQIMVRAGWIYKDNFFTFGYLLLSLWLACKDIQEKKFNWIENLIFFIILFYATSVKYQAQFILPILLFWYVSIEFAHFRFSFILDKVRPVIKNMLITIFLCFCVINGVKGVNNFLVTSHGKGSNHAWKYKLMYDLAGMSINSNKILLPKFLIRHETITMKDLQDHYKLAWEPLAVYEHSPLKIPANKDLAKLRRVWKQMIFNHPIAYLKHRLHIWVDGLLLPAPGKAFIMQKFAYKQSTSDRFSWLLFILSPLVKNFSWILSIFAYVFIFPFQIYFLYSSSKSYLKGNNKYAKSIFFMNLMGLSLLFLLLFFSLAGVPRYIYFTNVMFFFSIPFFIPQKKFQETKL